MDIFSLIYHFSFLSPSLWETARYRLKYCLKGPLSPKQPTNQHQSISGRLPKRGRKRIERIDESKNVQTTPTRTFCKCSRPLPYCHPNCRTPRHWKFTPHHPTTPCPTVIQIVGRPSTESLPSTIAPPHHPLLAGVVGWCDGAG